MSYDSPNAEVRRETTQRGVASAASAGFAKFFFFQRTKIKKVHWGVETAGTNAAAGATVLIGTDSVGSITFGTGAAGSMVSSGAINQIVPAGGFVQLTGLADSATAVGCVVIEHEVEPDAVKS